MLEFKDKILMITGGTGCFGNTVLKHFLSSEIEQIRIFSRDEKMQDDMRQELKPKYSNYVAKSGQSAWWLTILNTDYVRDQLRA